MTGESINAYILVALIPSSKYACVKALLLPNKEYWITVYINTTEAQVLHLEKENELLKKLDEIVRAGCRSN